MNYYQINQYQLATEEAVTQLKGFEISQLDTWMITFYCFNRSSAQGKSFFKITSNWTTFEAYENIKWLWAGADRSSLPKALIQLSERELLSGLNIGPWLEQLNQNHEHQYHEYLNHVNHDDLSFRMLTFENYVSRFVNVGFSKKRVHLLGLGDVGSTMAIGLKLLGEEAIHTLGLFDLNPNQKSRFEMELGQIIVNPNIRVEAIEMEDLFKGDVFIFCASKYVPAVGEQVEDVRMVQFKDNSKIIEYYAKCARKQKFKGLFCVVSDPVDLLCKSVYEASNTDELGEFDGKGLHADQIRGFGLGVMHGRGLFYGRKRNNDYEKYGRVYGPHGQDLIVVDNIQNYNHVESLELTDQVIRANLDVRAAGYKPYIAPAISSGAKSIIDAITGKWHFSATHVGDVFFGAYNRQTPAGIEYEQNHMDDQLIKRILYTYERLETLWQALKS